MTLIRRYDAYVLEKVKAFVVLCEEWISVSQSQLEIGCMVSYIVGSGTIDISNRAWLSLAFDGFVLWCMWDMHSKTSAERQECHAALVPVRIFCRVGSQCFVALSIMLLGLKICTASVALLVEAASVALFLALISISSDGENGKRRRIALAKLKELFGVEWMPEPVGSGV
jgi:hypothetical protein